MCSCTICFVEHLFGPGCQVSLMVLVYFLSVLVSLREGILGLIIVKAVDCFSKVL